MHSVKTYSLVTVQFGNQFNIIIYSKLKYVSVQDLEGAKHFHKVNYR